MDSDLYFRSAAAKRGPDPWMVMLAVLVLWAAILIGGAR